MTTLGDLRVKIDQTDDELVVLLKKRAELVLQVKATKSKENIDIYSSSRERQILDRVAALAKDGNFPLPALERIFSSIISASRSLIGEIVVSYLGPEWSLAHEASVRQFGENIGLAAEASSEEICAKVARGDAHFGVIPVESSVSGLITQSFDLIIESGLQIIAEVAVDRSLNLGVSKGGLGDVRVVYSDAETFPRCVDWIRANLPDAELRVVENNAVAGRTASKEPNAAAIVPAAVAEHLELLSLASGIEKELGSKERFVVVGHSSPEATGRDKTSVVCTVQERSGALRDVLQPFADRNVTLTKIESKPLGHQGGEYSFYIDVYGHVGDPQVSEALDSLRKICSAVHILGSYPASNS